MSFFIHSKYSFSMTAGICMISIDIHGVLFNSAETPSILSLRNIVKILTDGAQQDPIFSWETSGSLQKEDSAASQLSFSCSFLVSPGRVLLSSVKNSPEMSQPTAWNNSTSLDSHWKVSECFMDSKNMEQLVPWAEHTWMFCFYWCLMMKGRHLQKWLF